VHLFIPERFLLCVLVPCAVLYRIIVLAIQHAKSERANSAKVQS